MNDNVIPLRRRDEIGRTCEGQVPDELLGRPTCAGSVGPDAVDDDELDPVKTRPTDCD